MTPKEQIIANLTVLTNNACTSKIKFNFFGIEHECQIKFPADSWQLARSAGYTFVEVLNNTKDKTFELLIWILMFDFDESSHNYFITDIVLSSLWRPPTGSTSPHEDGRGLVIIKIESSVGDEIICHETTPTEPSYFTKLRTYAMDAGKITQYFSPWKMYYYDAGGKLVDEVNKKITTNEKIHLTHVHFTIPK